MNLIKKITLGLTAITIIGGVAAGTQIVETNYAGNYQIKQAAGTGSMSVKGTPGMYMQAFGSISTYRVADDYAIRGTVVRFRDGSTATITGTVKYRLPVSDVQRLKLHIEQRTYDTARNVLVRGSIEGALKQTANLFGAEEVYSTRRSEFIEFFRGQLSEGIYKTRSTKQVNEIVRDKDGYAIIAKPSVLAQYGFEIINIEINDIDFDAKTDSLISSRKDAEQQETLARAEALRATQDALTAEARGKASVATAKYEALVVKERAVIEAEKKTAMSKEATLQAEEQAKQIEANGEAEAFRQKALVEAGLSPREQAEFDMKTAIGTAQAYAKWVGPTIVVQSSGAGSDKLNVADALALKSMMDVASTMNSPKSPLKTK